MVAAQHSVAHVLMEAHSSAQTTTSAVVVAHRHAATPPWVRVQHIMALREVSVVARQEAMVAAHVVAQHHHDDKENGDDSTRCCAPPFNYITINNNEYGYEKSI